MMENVGNLDPVAHAVLAAHQARPVLVGDTAWMDNVGHVDRVDHVDPVDHVDRGG